jgi:hypothetical protein
MDGRRRIGNISVQNFYRALISTQNLPSQTGWKLKFWKWNVQLKMKLFIWMVSENKILTWDMLRRKGWYGPGIYFLCKNNSEDIDHLFIHCPFARAVWARETTFLRVKNRWEGENFNSVFDYWVLDKTVPTTLAVLICWYIWFERNQVIFEDKKPSIGAVACRIIGAHNPRAHQHKLFSRYKRPLVQSKDITFAFFDGASIRGGTICGEGSDKTA